MFDVLSTSYGAVGVDSFGPIADQLVGHLAPARGESLSDIGCGKGKALIRAAEHVGAKARLMGIDVSPGMLDQARVMLDRTGLARVERREMDAQGPRLGGEPFDTVAFSLVLFFIPGPVRALRSWRALLAPAGRIGITTFDGRDARREDVDSVFTPYLPAGMLDARTSGANGPFASDERVAGLFGHAGVSSVQAWNTDFDVAFADATPWRTWTMSVGQRAMWEAVPADKVAEVQERATGRLTRCIGDDGQIHLYQTIRTAIARITPPSVE